MMYAMEQRRLSCGTRYRAAIVALAMAVVLVTTVASTLPAQAQTFSVLYNFTGGTDGKTPYASLIEVGGNLYGTTHEGGASGYGTVFKVDPSGAETVLHSFTNTDGGYPWASLLRDAAGNFYGTTKAGGASGFGTVFKLDPSGTESVLHSFAAGADGVSPYAGLIRDSAGNLYGTTYGGYPDNGYGTVFKLDRNGTATALYTFTGRADGGKPLSGLVRDAAGNLYGTTSMGGTFGDGTLFKVDASGAFTVVHTFAGGTTDGALPSGLIRDKQGNLYGTTYFGGAAHSGTIFKVDANGTVTLLYSFAGGSDGAFPIASLVEGPQGNFYGTTYGGGAANYGTVFKLTPQGKETLLHSFNLLDGTLPYAGLVRDAAGNLYGTTQRGGAYGFGTVYKITP